MDKTVVDYQLALCLLEKECPNWRHNPGKGLPRTDDICPDCRETGRVPLLEGVREKCPSCLGAREHLRDDMCLYLCELCQGRGWIPSTDPLRYVEAVLSDKEWKHLTFWVDKQKKRFVCYLEGGHEEEANTLELSVLKALAQALGVKDA